MKYLMGEIRCEYEKGMVAYLFFYIRRKHKMTKAEMIVAVAEKAGMTKKDAEKVVTAVLETVTETLKKGDKITLTGFGSFEVKTRAAHAGINPKTGEAITIAASKAPVFKAGKGLKDAVK